ncbi:MAG: hypothetical protein A4E62_02628 [Syntrophorhabdus sp. PtaU1.Bin002]|nr:MAG: hypothetical protein A4E58_00776 [Syntrophorhabdus sp. PtaB.Bin006]OPY65701.1 MAG: hypothetical protein A4E62_02628 [Syntrophorhabdus sp. PtaU1.Bin002]
MSDERRPPISKEEIAEIEADMNAKLEAMGRMRDFFGSGHGVDVVALMSTWIAREIVPHEQRLGAKLRYTIETLPDGRSRFVVKDVTKAED